MKDKLNILTAITTIVLIAVYGAGLLVGHAQGKADELARWRQIVIPLGLSLAKRYDPITGEAKMVLIKSDGQTTVLEAKP
jgi:hypothetical protein